MATYKTTTVKRLNVKPMVFELQINDPPPPLVLLINPTSLEIKFTPKIMEQRTRWAGNNVPYIFQAHHDELDTLSATGKSGMFFSDEKGLTRIERRESYSFENLSKLIAIYRNNGTNRNTKPNSYINPCMIDSVGRVVLSYNAYIYRGHFTSFSTTENDSMPFNMDFSFEFKVTSTFSIDYATESNILKGFLL